MAKYVYHVPNLDHGCGRVADGDNRWSEAALAFGNKLQAVLASKYGLTSCVFPEEGGVELDEGCAGMGKDWFNFKFRVFADTAIYLDMINIPFEWRHKGIGWYLISELKNFAAANSLGYIFLGSYEPSNPFWDRCGFVKISEYPEFIIGEDDMAK